ncbi:MAG: glycosyltransferase family 39 protein [Anaerolineae bacterium]
MSQRRIKSNSIFHNSRMTEWAVCALVLLCFTLGVWRNDAKSMWWDESLSLQRAQSGFDNIVSGQLDSSAGMTTDQHPPFYFLLLRSMILLAGDSNTVLRLLSTLFSSLLVPLLYLMGCHLRNRRTGFLAACLGTLSPFLLWYAQEMRMYTLVTFLGLLSTLLLWQAIAKNKGHLGVAFILVVCLGLLTQYLFVLLLPAQCLFALLIWPHHKATVSILRSWKLWIGRIALVILTVLLAILTVMVIRLIPGLGSNRTFVPLWMILRDVFNSFSLGLSVNYFTIWPLDIVYFILFILGLVTILWSPFSPSHIVREPLPKRASGFILLSGYIFIPIILIWLFSYIMPLYMGSRYLIMSTPAFILAVALGVDALAGWRPLVAWLCGLFLIGSMGYSIIRYHTITEYANKEDYRAAARNIAINESSADIILVKWAEVIPAFRLYYEGHLQVISLKELDNQWNENENALEQFAQLYDRIWLVEGNEQNTDPMKRVRNWLSSNTLLLSENSYPGYVYPVKLTSFFPRSPYVDLLDYNAAPLGVFGQKIQLVDYSLRYFTDQAYSFKVAANEIRANSGMTNSVPAGHTIGVYLTMRTLQPLPDCKTSLRLVDDQGRLIAQRDEIPLMYLPTSQWLVDKGIQFQTYVRIPLGTPPGQYRLVLLYYRQADGQAFSFQDTASSLEVPWYEISSIRVSEGQPFSYESNSLPDGQTPLVLPPRFGPLQLLGYTTSPGAHAGSSFVLPLYWQALGTIKPDLELVINWRDSTGHIWLTSYLNPLSSGDNQAIWPVGALRRSLNVLEVPADAPRGKSDLFLLVRLRDTNQYYDLWRGFFPLIRHAFRLGSVQID